MLESRNKIIVIASVSVMNAHAERVCVLRYDSIKVRSIFASQFTDTTVRCGGERTHSVVGFNRTDVLRRTVKHELALGCTPRAARGVPLSLTSTSLFPQFSFFW